MQTLKLKAKELSVVINQIFGNSDTDKANALVFKNLSQKVKFHLRKLGEKLSNEEVDIIKQVRELMKEYDEKKKGLEGDELKKVNEELDKAMKELEELDIEVKHYPFTEEDFIDSKTGKVVGGEGIYYTLIDDLIYESIES